MASYRVEFGRAARKDLQRLDARTVERVIDKIASLADQPRPPQSKKMVDEDHYRLHRVIYDIDDTASIVYVVYVRHRRNVYRRRAR
jgi:mRNA interferase RelE/StbE